jgi:hypothetical protein
MLHDHAIPGLLPAEAGRLSSVGGVLLVTTSRSIVALGIAAALIFACGCGSDPEPAAPETKVDDTKPAPQSAPTPQTTPAPPPSLTGPIEPVPKVEPPKAIWELDQTKHVIPDAPVKGSIAGVEAAPAVLIEGPELTFRVIKSDTGMVERSVKLNLAPMLVAGQALPQILGRGWKVKLEDDAGPGVPEVWREVTGKDPHLYPSGYALTLELGPRKDGKVAGKIYLSMSDAEKTYLAGTFEAQYVRPHTERPGPDDAPYIAGDLTVTGAKPDAEVRVSYVGFSGMHVMFKELQLAADPVPEQLARWTRDEADKPRASTFVAGDGRERPFRYEHVKLPAGRYLISAAVVGGPAVWKWVELPAGGTQTVNLALDAAKAGGVEVTVPAGVAGKVYLAPADDPDRPPLEFDLFVAVAFQAVRQDAEIVGGKALVKNLAPGKYEVRAGELRGTVEIVADKTAELTLATAKKP